MNFELTDRAKDYAERVEAFMDERIYPAEAVYEQQMRESGTLRLADGPDEVHKRTIAQGELRRWEPSADRPPSAETMRAEAVPA